LQSFGFTFWDGFSNRSPSFLNSSYRIKSIDVLQWVYAAAHSLMREAHNGKGLTGKQFTI